MRLLVQRVKEASVTCDGHVSGKISRGLLVFVGIHSQDSEKEALFLAKKLASLRIFPDQDGKMNLSVEEAGGSLLIVSQFTLYGNCLSGRRPDFQQAAPPELALPLFQFFVRQVKIFFSGPVAEGVFGGKMEVALINEGPVTFWIEK